MTDEREVICGFTVSEKRKKVWQTELAMLKEFIRICEKHDLKYFAMGGTLLGAVRHGGYIPWDDDIDLMMPRADYEKFLACAQELPDNLFVQTYKTERDYITGHAQLRNSDTACILKGQYRDLQSGINCGIFIDIFPYECVPDDIKERARFAKKIKRLRKLASRKKYYGKTGGFKGLLKSVYMKLFVRKTACEYMRDIDRIAQRYNYNTHTYARYMFVPGREQTTWDESLLDESVLLPFCDIMIRAPKEYDKMLTKQYGNYMELPEDRSGSGSAHGVALFDTERSYTEYKKYSKEEIDKMIADATL